MSLRMCGEESNIGGGMSPLAEARCLADECGLGTPGVRNWAPAESLSPSGGLLLLRLLRGLGLRRSLRRRLLGFPFRCHRHVKETPSLHPGDAPAPPSANILSTLRPARNSLCCPTLCTKVTSSRIVDRISISCDHPYTDEGCSCVGWPPPRRSNRRESRESLPPRQTARLAIQHVGRHKGAAENRRSE